VRSEPGQPRSRAGAVLPRAGAGRRHRRSFAGMLALALRFAMREMRGGLSGFFIFVTCIALGVAAIGGVNSVAQAITIGVQSQGQALLGGDIRFRLIHREADDGGTCFPRRSGGGGGQRRHFAPWCGWRTVADQTLVEVKAVDEAYPLYGESLTAPVLPLERLFGA
jgi:putative ABC transport system permease protein